MSSKTVDENYKRLRAELDEQLSKDKRLTAIADKISKGAADFSDTARYTQIVSKHMSDVIKRNIGELKQPMAKEMVCKELLRDHYELINGVFGEVQVSVDEKLGIHLNPIKPAYPAERVDKWAHSLEDPTVEPSVTERRAASGSENIGNSIHDDCIKENAKVREQAGLDCYLTRDAGGGCCPWCATLEGRFSYADAPDDIFRRHDNCTCTVTYECGKMRQDVWSKKTWEADPKDIEARKAASEAARPTVKTPAEAQAINEQSKSNITVLSKEQAEALNEQNKPTVFTEAEAKEREAMALGKGDNVNNKSVDKPEESGIIASDTLKMAAPLQSPPDFSKYEIKQDLQAVNKLKNEMSEKLGIPLSDIDLDGIQNTEALEPFVKRLEKIQRDTGMKFPKICSVGVIDGDETCISGYKPYENTLYISSQYFNSKDALLDTLKQWSNEGILPKQAKSIAYLAEHESAHIRIPDDKLRSKEALDIYREFKKSNYINENDKKSIYEFYADSVAWHRISPNSTPQKMLEAVELLKKEGIS